MSEKTTIVIPMGVLTDDEIKNLQDASGTIELITEEEKNRRIDKANKESFEPYRLALRKLNFNQKMEWYHTRHPLEIVALGSNPYFMRYWNLHVMTRLRLIRFYYKLKTGEFWRKKYTHISDLRAKEKKETQNVSTEIERDSSEL